jgi:hypothetical protein
MKLTTSILLITMASGSALAQNPDIIQNTKDTLHAVAKKAENDQNAVLNGGQAQNQPKPTVPGRTVVTPSKPAAAVAAPKPSQAAPKEAAAPKAAAAKVPPTKLTIAPVAPQPKQGAQKTAPQAGKKKSVAQHADPMLPPQKKVESVAKLGEAKPAAAAPAEDSSESKGKKTITAEGRRDPFISPVVSRATGPACSTGKRCLAIDQISVRGVVKSDNGMIAVVVNSLNKAYFLKENDPVYNGYVLRITGDSVVFKETFQDRLGKELTREVVKKLTTPAV